MDLPLEGGWDDSLTDTTLNFLGENFKDLPRS